MIMSKRIVKGFAVFSLVSSSIFSLSACSFEEELTPGEQEYITLSEEEKEMLNDDQEAALIEARKDELKEMTAAERAVLPTKEQKEAQKEKLGEIARNAAEDVQ